MMGQLDPARSSASEVETAAAVVIERLAVTSRDVVAVICNPELPDASELVSAVTGAASAWSKQVRVHEYPAGSRDGEEPSAEVADAMGYATVLVLLTRYSISHTRARMRATDAGARIASMPGISRDTFARALPAEYEQLCRVGEAIGAKLTAAHGCRVTSRAGTDVHLSLEGRTAIVDDGNLRAPGAFGNLPAGEAYIAPSETNASGTIVFDGSLAEWGILEEPLTVVLKQGRAIDLEGGPAAQWLRETLDAGGRNGRVIAELGIGTNPRAQVSGNVLEDEKVAGTVHFAFGTNTSMGGDNQASVHLDALVLKPRVELDGIVILDDSLSVT